MPSTFTNLLLAASIAGGWVIPPSAIGQEVPGQPEMSRLSHEQLLQLQELERKTRRVPATDFKGSVDEFVADDDATTVQVVLVPAGKLEDSRTSTDGQVIFLRQEDATHARDRLQKLFLES